MSEAHGEITRLLNEVHEGRKGALDQLMELVYAQLHRLAKRYLEAGFPRIAPAVAVLVVLRLEAGDVDAGVFWLRLLRAAVNLEQVEPDSGAMLH